MYPNNASTTPGGSINTFWSKGQAVYLSPDFGDALTALTDADHARFLRTRRSVSVYFILHNSVIISWRCKKQPITSINSTGSEITALHKGASKTLLIRKLLTATNIFHTNL
jgi:hypothetical protein